MIKGILLFASALIFAGCASTDLGTASGRPEAFAEGVSRASTIMAFNEAMINRGYTIVAESASRVVYEKAADNFAAQLLFGSQYNTVPNLRVTMNYLQVSGGTRVIADLAVITNPGSGFAKPTSANQSADAARLQKWMRQVAEGIN